MLPGRLNPHPSHGRVRRSLHFRSQLRERLWQTWRRLPPLWLISVPLSAVYGLVLAVRSQWWQRMAQRPPLPAVSIGNLTLGGNSKTPFALFIALGLQRRGLKPAIVSRGYGGHSSRKAKLVFDGECMLMDSHQAGDEPVMLAKCFAGPVAVARRRIDAIEMLEQYAAAELVVLDDGFQHIRLKREVDLLLINRGVTFGNGWLLPAGPLREPLRAISRADMIVLIGIPEAQTGETDSYVKALAPGKPVLSARLIPSALISSDQGLWREEPPVLKGRLIVAVSGLANPSSFHAMLRNLGGLIVRTLDYPDHHDYGPADWENIVAAASGAEILITTEKDLVKLERFHLMGVSLKALRLKVAMEPQDEACLFEFILGRVAPALCTPGQRSWKGRLNNGA
jgi:tetraacyldisaccharide 4'-kinase